MFAKCPSVGLPVDVRNKGTSYRRNFLTGRLKSTFCGVCGQALQGNSWTAPDRLQAQLFLRLEPILAPSLDYCAYLRSPTGDLIVLTEWGSGPSRIVFRSFFSG